MWPSLFVAGKRHPPEIARSIPALLLRSPREDGLVSGTRFIRLNDLPEFDGQEITDVCAMHFDPAEYGEPKLERGFFNVGAADVWNGESETTFLVYGYPTQLRELSIDEISGALDGIKVKMTANAGLYS
jgi:hypothetical protein